MDGTSYIFPDEHTGFAKLALLLVLLKTVGWSLCARNGDNVWNGALQETMARFEPKTFMNTQYMPSNASPVVFHLDFTPTKVSCKPE